MVKLCHDLLLILFISCLFTAALAASSTENFIKTSCKATPFPATCVRSLNIYADLLNSNPRRLSEIALNVTLRRAQVNKKAVFQLTQLKMVSKTLKKRQYQAVNDCAEETGNAIDRLVKSVEELRLCVNKVRGCDRFGFHMINVRTWVGSVLTDKNSTCFDWFTSRGLDGRIKASIRHLTLQVVKLTSNALALTKPFASNH